MNGLTLSRSTLTDSPDTLTLMDIEGKDRTACTGPVDVRKVTERPRASSNAITVLPGVQSVWRPGANEEEASGSGA